MNVFYVFKQLFTFGGGERAHERNLCIKRCVTFGGGTEQ